MSKAAKQSLIILGVLLLVSFGYAVFLFTQKMELEKEKTVLTKNIDEYKIRENNFKLTNQQLQQKIDEIGKEKAELETRIAEFEGVDIDALKAQAEELTKEKQEWQKRLDKLKKERDQLTAKLQEKPEKEIVYKYVEQPQPEITPQPTEAQVGQPDDETYWAKVLKERADLQLKIDEVQQKLVSGAVEIEELKKKNSDLQLELGKMTNDKEAIERQIKHGNDLSDTLSLELARTQNEKKFLDDRVTKINDENLSLRDKIKQLTSTKIALEKSIVRLQDEKKGLERKLQETENVIQGRIDEIWKIKEDLNKNFKPAKSTKAGEIELPPIVVSADSAKQDTKSSAKGYGYQGNIVSINNENNFVIVDLGESRGLKLGDNLSVYRGAEYIAGLEVIQLREDIAAADIKDKVSSIQIGDVVR